jgi:MFS family permease
MGMYIPFMDNVNRFYQKRFCFTQISAGKVITITYLMSGIVSLPIGFAVDKFGKRRALITMTMMIFLLAHVLILLYPQCDGFELYGATIGLFLIGIGYSGYANCLISSIPLIVKKKVIGTAFGLM